MTPKLSRSQIEVLRALGDPNADGYAVVHGRGPIASARVLGRHGLAARVVLSFCRFNGDCWRLTEAGKLALSQIDGEVQP